MTTLQEIEQAMNPIDYEKAKFDKALKHGVSDLNLIYQYANKVYKVNLQEVDFENFENEFCDCCQMPLKDSKGVIPICNCPIDF